jgi:flagellar biosynthesis protein FlhB
MSDTEAENSDKTEAPSDKRRKEATEKGDILKSREFAVALSMVAGFGILSLTGQQFLSASQHALGAGLSLTRGDIEQFDLVPLVWRLVQPLTVPLALLLAAALLAGLAGQAFLSGIRIHGGLLAPKASRLNPGAGLVRMFGRQGALELLKSCLKVVFIGIAGSVPLWGKVPDILRLAAGDSRQAALPIFGILSSVCFSLCLAFGAMALIDVPLRWRQLQTKLRMTRQEVRDEAKQSEGAPELKQGIRQRQREILRRDVRKGVKTAHVVLTNPTEFAVALRYDRQMDREPVLVARGKGEGAAYIRALADAYDVPVLSYPLLARAIYFTSRHGQSVSPDLYLAVATVLAFVFSMAPQGDDGLPPVDVPDHVRFDSDGHPLSR